MNSVSFIENIFFKSFQNLWLVCLYLDSLWKLFHLVVLMRVLRWKTFKNIHNYYNILLGACVTVYWEICLPLLLNFFPRFSDNRGDKLWPKLNFFIIFLIITPSAPSINVVFPQTSNTSQASMYTSTLMLGEQGESDFEFRPQYYRHDCRCRFPSDVILTLSPNTAFSSCANSSDFTISQLFYH